MESLNFTGQLTTDAIAFTGDATSSQIIATGKVAQQGVAGKDGVGIPTGGLGSALLGKTSDTDYETGWVSPLDLPISTLVQASLDQRLLLTGGTLTGVLKTQLTDSTPGIPDMTADGVWSIFGGDGSRHLGFMVDLDGDGDYDADIWFKDNGYLVAENFLDIRSGKDATTGEYVGRIRFKALINEISGVGTNYMQNGRRYNGLAPFNDWAFTDYNASFAWLFFDQDQNGYAYFGNKLDPTTGLYAQALARVHVYDGASTVALFQSFNGSGTGRIGLMDINTTSGSAVTIGAFGDKQIFRAESTNYARGNAIGLYSGGNADATAHLHAAPSTTAAAALRIPSGVAPTSPNDGDIWYDGTSFHPRISSITDTFVTLAAAQIFTGADIFAPTNGTSAFIVANSTLTTHMLRVDTQNGRIGINLSSATALNSTLAVNGMSVLGGGATTATALADIQASSTSRASARVRSGTAPTSPNDGDIWNDGSRLQGNFGGATKPLDTGYTLQAFGGTFSPADATTYYFGNLFNVAPMTSGGHARIPIPRSGTIKRAYISFNEVAGTSETSTMNIRVNNTTSTQISAAVINDTVDPTILSNTSLSIAVTSGDYIEIEWATPTWATNPTSVRPCVTLYIE